MTPDETLPAVRAALEAYVDPYLGETLGAAQAVRDVRAAGSGFAAQVVLGFPTGGYERELVAALNGQLAGGGESCTRLGGPGRTGWDPRCRHLRPEPATHAGPRRAASHIARWQA